MTGPLALFRARFLDVLASIYIYNEYRGYTSLDRVLEAVRARCPDEADFIAAVEKHRGDERKHYVMFRRWFERQGRMPLMVDRTCGHIDHFIQRVFGCTIEELDTAAIVSSPEAFEQLCRVIMLTEQRGMRQVEVLLRNGHVRSDPVMNRLFRIVEKDEPDHWIPYERWLAVHGRARARWRERWADYWIHKSLMLVKLPMLFLRRSTPRMARWPDEAAPAS
ncbi:ferritin-like domain-containing protein [Novosphingobium sp. KCTC 2891]|uniref:ferritin-like domain-containing protein n=1 Tax=Novosphingobium sp. KCTC 2891 TaxID=2989730 RepID=UPI0022229FAA|nr:ferritin-like domain-containing protein [Novosphingobium sp. KCTC 2891]MCW1383099.1 ferritin-like domain-containing protein [Novosphingobium sp. KCTC 2891]